MDKLRVMMIPHPAKISGNASDGISQVVLAYARHLPDFGVDIANPDDLHYDLIACHAGLTGPVNDVSHLHGLHWTGDYDAPTWEYRVNERIAEAVHYAREITVPSEWVAETIRRDLRVSPTIIPHGISWQDWQHDEPKGDYILWNKNRADEWVCDARPLVELANHFPKAHFVTTMLPKNVGPPYNVNAIGVIPHDQMKKLVQSAMVYLSTTKETFGIGILEAMASGVPVLGYAHGGILETVEHGVNGYLVEPGDLEGLAEGLRYCIRHHKTLGDNGREMARAWTWERAVAQVAEVYRRAAQHQPATVGVVIPVYNKTEEELRRAVESANSQSLEPDRIVVVDDGSTNGVDYESLIRQFGTNHADRIVYRRYDNKGVAIARNRGIELLNTKYVCCLDGDDWIEPDFLRVCVEALEKDRSLGIAYTGLRWHKPDGTTGLSQWPGDWDFDKQLEKQNQVPTCNVFRRVMWERLGGYRQRYAPKGCGAEDGELWLRAGAYGFKAARVTQDALFNYSWMSGLASGDPDYKEPDWLLWHPWTRDGLHPFASYAKPERYSHPVRAYDTPAVSVVIPVGPGHERTVIDALDSLEAQTFRKWEAIVIWDQADPIPQDLMTAYPYAKWHQMPEGPAGAGKARNLGAKLARAPFLLFLDADDWLYPEALHYMVSAWNAKQAIIYSDYVGKAIVEPDKIKNLAPDLQHKLYHYNERNNEAVIGYKAFEFDCERIMQQPEEPRPYIWCNVTALIPTVWHKEIGGFDEKMPSWEDYDYHLRHARAGHCYYHLEKELLVYRYYTGIRRERGRQISKSLVQYIKQKFESEDDPVGCASCPGGRRKSTARSAPAPAAPLVATSKLAETPGPDHKFIKIKYVEPKRGSHEVIGSSAVDPSTGRRFKYGWRCFGDVFTVHIDDVYERDRRTGQRVIRDKRFQPIEEKVIEAPEEEKVETPPPMALVFDPQTLPGVNPKMAAAMLERGLTGKDKILAVGLDGLIEVPGIGPKTASKIIDYLNR